MVGRPPSTILLLGYPRNQFVDSLRKSLTGYRDYEQYVLKLQTTFRDEINKETM